MTEVARPIPDVDVLAKDVCDALEEVGKASDWISANPTNPIGDALKRRLREYPEGVECAYDRNLFKDEDEREFLFDFSAIICEPRDNTVERCTLQLLVAGEVEFGAGLTRDFEKLMYADALVCFFAFSDRTKEHQIEFFVKVAERRINHVVMRGNIPPVFILACHSRQDRRFEIRVIRHEID